MSAKKKSVPLNVACFLRLLEMRSLPAPVAEYRFHPTRKWRMDYAWPEQRLALEIQGGIFVNGRHSRGAALLKEWEKLNTAASMGWRFLFVQPVDLCSKETLNYIELSLGRINL